MIRSIGKLSVMEISCKDPVILNQWHPVSSLDVLTMDTVENTILLESKISFKLKSKEEAAAWLSLDDKKLCYRRVFLMGLSGFL